MKTFLMNLEYYYELFQSYSIFIKILYTLIFVLVCVCLYDFFFLIRKHRYRIKTERRKQYLKDTYFNKIRELLSTDRVFHREEFHDYLGINTYDGGFKRQLTNLILEAKEGSSPINENNYELLMEDLKLKKFWEKELQSGSKKRQERALRKIKGLNLVIAESILIPMTSDKNSILRRKARSLYIYISKNNPFKFFDEDFDEQFSQWDHIEIHEILSKKPENTIPSFIQWVQEHSAGEGLKSFLVYEMGHYKQKGASEYLIKMIETSGVKLRQNIIRTLGILGYSEAAPFLIGIYPVQSPLIQEEILRVLGVFARQEDLPFVHQAIERSHTIETKMQGLRTLLNFGDEGKELFESLKSKANENELLAFEHVANPLNQKDI